jgi:nitrate reductase NapE component
VHVLAFLVAAELSIVAIFIADPVTYAQAMRLDQNTSQPAGLLAVLAISLIVAVAIVGVFGRWRWLFWVLLLAFLPGPLRVIASGMEVLGVVADSAPTWYVAYQGGLGLIQFAIGLLMVRGYRRTGVWGAF